jgi:predicted ArsR family transcriptional regulator
MADWIEGLSGVTRAKLLRLLRRSKMSIAALAGELDVTDNAIRTQIASLERDGIVEGAGVHRETGGKPARLYGLTKEGEELFPKAYALVLNGLIEEITRREGKEGALELLREVGRRAASGQLVTDDVEARVSAAANMLRSLGGDVDVHRTDGGWHLKGYACPLSAVTTNHAELCELARSIVQEITGRTVVECCDRSDRPRCGFTIAEQQG